MCPCTGINSGAEIERLFTDCFYPFILKTIKPFLRARLFL
jgi:hypothetical protein